jgi:hypothetical protein
MEINKRCLACNEIISGRKDKKFCNSYCRTHYHNIKNRESTDQIKEINKILRKNRNILKELSIASKTIVTKWLLLEKGFSFRYFTGIYKSESKNVYNLCYDHAYRDLGNGKYLLIKQKIYTTK